MANISSLDLNYILKDLNLNFDTTDIDKTIWLLEQAKTVDTLNVFINEGESYRLNFFNEKEIIAKKALSILYVIDIHFGDDIIQMLEINNKNIRYDVNAIENKITSEMDSIKRMYHALSKEQKYSLLVLLSPFYEFATKNNRNNADAYKIVRFISDCLEVSIIDAGLFFK
ncbi:hypothetical protein LJC43_04695, partial [Parabacteroides sp. OttesenSCG-928-G21]|nr:hypothetical protein [Parabacteroides sp. OttesenSCG-928-G21]